ncbi:MAG TPA: ABC transporter substrate-binding protein [Nitriliruptorales bacterium]|nr:ABC transporter substrate-binding protein [Nitriliruptorales bacterium]
MHVPLGCTAHSAGLALAVAVALTACGGSGGDRAVGRPAGGVVPTGEATGEVATDVGVTEEPCAAAVNPENGCVYLGSLSDLSAGPFSALAVPITDAQEAFWRRVNEQGGVGGYDIDVTTYTRDNQYDPQVHRRLYRGIEPHVLALAQTLGSPTTAAIIDDLEASGVLAAPVSWTSRWLFHDVIVESGSTYCIDPMNGLDWLTVEGDGPDTVMAMAFPGDYGGDAAAGARIWAEANDAQFSYVEQVPVASGGTTTAAVDAILDQGPDVVVLAVSPQETGEIVAGTVARGYEGRFLGVSPSYNPGLLQSAARDAVVSRYMLTAPWATTFSGDAPGARAMRAALGEGVAGNEGYTSGWIWSYPLKAALEQAVASGDLTRRGLFDAVKSLESVDYEGMLGGGAGHFAGGPDAAAVRVTTIAQPSGAGTSGYEIVEPNYSGPTAQGYEFGDGPCYQTVSPG